MMKTELLAPAGDLEKLKYAIVYGADAVYFAGKKFGLRAATANFSMEEMIEGLDFVHERGKKAYLVLNILAHEGDLTPIRDYLYQIKGLPFDGFIISDPGILLLAKEILGEREYHLSTQASSTNSMAASFWRSQGVSRIVLARELSLEEVRSMVAANPSMEFEVFIHGAMCISYSGRCLISHYMTQRDANQGDCAQSCRWNYALMEKSREGEYFPIEEDERGSYFFNSKDLCTMPILEDIVKTGVKSLKVEGRNKSIYYVASVIRAYREALDRIEKGLPYDPVLYEEVSKVSHRDYTLGFYKGEMSHEDQVYESSSYIRKTDFLGIVLEYNQETNWVKIEQRNKFALGDEIEIIGPEFRSVKFTVEAMKDEQGQDITSCPHPQSIIYLYCPEKVFPMDLLRREI